MKMATGFSAYSHRNSSLGQTHRELVYRSLQFREGGQHFVSTHDETLSVAMRVHNPNRSPLNIEAIEDGLRD